MVVLRGQEELLERQGLTTRAFGFRDTHATAVTPKYPVPAKGSKSSPGEEMGALERTAKVLIPFAKPVIIPQRLPSAAAATMADLMVSLERS